MTATVGSKQRRGVRLAVIAILAGASFLATGSVAVASAKPIAPETATAASRPSEAFPGVLQSPPVTYESDGYNAPTCSGTSSALNYIVFYPSSPGPHPIIFGMSGTGFSGNAGCNSSTGEPRYETADMEMERWAAAGFVAVNIEYHGYDNGLYGDVTYPGPGNWGDIADGTTQLDIKPAIEYFMANNPGQYGANENSGVIAFGDSSGAHNAYMLGVTGVPGVPIWAAIGWSGLPDAQLAGSTAEGVFDDYMRTSPGTDVENFADPEHRISASTPPEYIANGTQEFINPANAEQYFQTCTQVGVRFCYERILNTSAHASGYDEYTFTGQSPEMTNPQATVGETVFEDSIAYANAVIAAGPPSAQTARPPAPPAILTIHLRPHKAWLVGVEVAGQCVRRTTQKHGRSCDLPVKLKLSYTLNESATVILKVQRETGGRRAGGKCVRQTGANRTHRFCWRWVKLHGKRTLHAKADANSYTFNGRIGGSKLGAGTYLLTLTPSGGASRQVTFTIFA